MARLCHHKCMIKQQPGTAHGCPNWGLRTTDRSRDQRLQFLKITMVFASNYSPTEVLDQKSFAKILVVRSHNQSEKERRQGHVPGVLDSADLCYHTPEWCTKNYASHPIYVLSCSVTILTGGKKNVVTANLFSFFFLSFTFHTIFLSGKLCIN